MKWLLGLLLIPTFCWSSCEGLKEAIEKCSPYTCEIKVPKIGKIIDFKIISRKDNVCIIVTENINPESGKAIVRNCRVKEKALPFLAKQWASENEILEFAMDTNLSDVKRTHDEMYKRHEIQTQKQQAYHIIKDELEKNLLAASDGKSPCIP